MRDKQARHRRKARFVAECADYIGKPFNVVRRLEANEDDGLVDSSMAKAGTEVIANKTDLRKEKP